MWAMLPCPKELLKTGSRAEDLQDYDGCWVSTQDPSIITNAGAAGIVGATLHDALEGLERHLGSPPKFTRLEKDSMWVWMDGHKDQSEAEREMVKELIQKLGDPESRKKQHHSSDKVEIDKVEIWKVRPHPKADNDATQIDMMAQAKLSSDGIICGKQIPADWKFDYYDRRRVNPVGNGFLVENTHWGTKLIYNPRRVKALETRRRNLKKKKQEGYLKYTYTPHECLLGILEEQIKVLWRDPLPWLGRQDWRYRDMRGTGDSILKFYKLAGMLRCRKSLRKKYAKWIRRLYFHWGVVSGKVRTDFKEWYHDELKIVGVPKSKRRYQAKKRGY